MYGNFVNKNFQCSLNDWYFEYIWLDYKCLSCFVVYLILLNDGVLIGGQKFICI